jgi:hypothetical protein
MVSSRLSVNNYQYSIKEKENYMNQNFIVCENERPAYVGDSVNVTVNGGPPYVGVITSIPSGGSSFCLNHDAWFDLSMDSLTVCIIGRKIEDAIARNPDIVPEPDPREELKDLKERIKELEKKAKDLERYETYAKAADEMAAVRQAFVDKGFSKTESFALLRDFIKASNGMARR